jgi:WD40 repeat protein
MSTRTGLPWPGILLLVSGMSAAPAKEPDEPLPPNAIARLGTSRFCVHGGVYACRPSPDGTRFVVQTDGRTVFLDATTGKTLREVPGGEMFRGPRSAFTADGKKIVTSRWDGIDIWDLASAKVERTLTRKERRPGNVALSADGKVLVVGFVDFDGPATVFNLASGAILFEARPEAGPEVQVGLSPDGKRLATWGPHLDRRNEAKEKDLSRVVQVWDVAARKETHWLRTDTHTPEEVHFSPDGSRLVTSGDGVLQVWDAVSGKAVCRIQAKLGAKTRVCFSRDGKQVLATGPDAAAGCWDAASGKLLRRGAVPPVPPDGVVPGADRYRAWGRQGNVLHIWDPLSGKLLSFRGHPGGVAGLEFSADGRTLYSSGRHDPRVLTWNAAGGEPTPLELKQDEESRKKLSRPVYGYGPMLAFAPAARFIAAAHHYESLVLVHKGDGDRHFALNIDSAYPNEGTFFFSPDAHRFVLFPAYADRITVWDVGSGAAAVTLSRPTGRGNWHSGAFSPDGQLLAAAWNTDHGYVRRSCQIRVHDLTSGKVGVTIPIRDTRANSIRFLDGRRLLVLGAEKEALLGFDVRTGRPLREFEGTPAGFLTGQLALSLDGRLVAAACGGEAGEVNGKRTAPPPARVLVWEVASGRLRHVFEGHVGPVYAFAFSPDGTRLASGGEDTTILVWDLRGGAVKGSESVEALWKALDDLDARRAETAMRQLAARREEALQLLRRELKPVAAVRHDPEAIARLIRDLDAKQFAVRESASKQLEKMGLAALPAIEAALKASPPPEPRERLRRLRESLRRIDPNDAFWREHLRAFRSVELLERIGTPEAVSLLNGMAGGDPLASPTLSARTALRRLGKP